jgi:hypothetical protein
VRRIIPMAVAISVGLIVLAGRFVQNVYLNGLSLFFLDTAVIVAAFAVLLGFVNVLSSHVRKIRTRSEGWPYSIVLILFSLAVLVTGYGGPASPLLRSLFNTVQYPLQATIASLLIFFAAAALFRVARVRGWATLLFVVVVVVVLIGQLPLFNSLTAAKDWIMTVPALAGTRGIIIGVALGTVFTGLRLLMGIDRPYSE